jgi:predicted nicotinamide N-methyase
MPVFDVRNKVIKAHIPPYNISPIIQNIKHNMAAYNSKINLVAGRKIVTPEGDELILVENHVDRFRVFIQHVGQNSTNHDIELRHDSCFTKGFQFLLHIS